jgi:heat shock protein HslJ
MKNVIEFLLLTTILPTFIFIFTVNISAQTGNEILIVADRKAQTADERAAECLAVKRVSEEKFSPMCQNIENFKYLPGYFYVLEIRVLTANNTGKKYRLRKILARVKSENASMPSSSAASLSGAEWKLMKINVENVGASKAFVKFDEAKNSVGGNGGCNSFGGQMVKNGAKLNLSQIFSTKMFCEQRSEIENKFLGSLEKVTKYTIAENRLSLKSGDIVLLEFERRN